MLVTRSSYVPFDPSKSKESVEAMKRLESSIEEIPAWMIANYMCLNDGMTEFQILGDKTHLEKVMINYVTVGNRSKKTARNIGTHFNT